MQYLKPGYNETSNGYAYQKLITASLVTRKHLGEWGKFTYKYF